MHATCVFATDENGEDEKGPGTVLFAAGSACILWKVPNEIVLTSSTPHLLCLALLPGQIQQIGKEVERVA